MIRDFIARNVAWLALRWLAAEEFRAWEGPKEAIVMLSVSKEVLRSRLLARPTVESPLVPTPTIILYPGRSRKLAVNQ